MSISFSAWASVLALFSTILLLAAGIRSKKYKKENLRIIYIASIVSAVAAVFFYIMAY